MMAYFEQLTNDQVLWLVIVMLISYVIYKIMTRKDRTKTSAIQNRNPGTVRCPYMKTASTTDKSFIGKMQREKIEIAIFFGTQSGKAEDMAKTIIKDLARYNKKAILINPETIDVNDLARLVEVHNIHVILVVATFGVGEPTDNAYNMHDYLQATDSTMVGVKFAVFGLGNRTYQHFNAAALSFDRRFEELGAQRIFEIGLGDDNEDLEMEFVHWKDRFVPRLAELNGWQISPNIKELKDYQLELLPAETTSVFQGELSRIGSFENQKGGFDIINPFYAPILLNQELHKNSGRSCKHIMFENIGCKLRYEAGDHLGVYPSNDSNLVDELLQRLHLDPNQVFRMAATDPNNIKRHPFPCPTTYKIAFKHYIDISYPCKLSILQMLSHYCVDQEDQNRLNELCAPTPEGRALYGSYITKARRSIVDILREIKSCVPDIGSLIELLPRLQIRYYSIASSPKFSKDAISICAGITEYNLDNRYMRGVCSNYLMDLKVGDRVPIFTRRSKMRLPPRHTQSIVLIGPGTGFAPFRGFLQERKFFKNNGRTIGEVHVFFGCRSQEDFIFKDETMEFLKDGIATSVNVAFSRQQSEKVYVQDKLYEKREQIWTLIQNGAYIYVCGDASRMAKDVRKMFIQIIVEAGKMTVEEAAEFVDKMEKTRRYQADVWA